MPPRWRRRIVYWKRLSVNSEPSLNSSQISGPAVAGPEICERFRLAASDIPGGEILHMDHCSNGRGVHEDVTLTLDHLIRLRIENHNAGYGLQIGVDAVIEVGRGGF